MSEHEQDRGTGGMIIEPSGGDGDPSVDRSSRAPAAHRPWSTTLLRCLVASLALWVLLQSGIWLDIARRGATVIWSPSAVGHLVLLLGLIAWIAVSRRRADLGRRGALRAAAVVAAVVAVLLLAQWLVYVVHALEIGAPGSAPAVVIWITRSLALGVPACLYLLAAVAGVRTFARTRA